MPRRAAPAAKAPAESGDELCPEHFPEGWDTAHVHSTHRSVSCEHGEWTRTVGDRAAVAVHRAEVDVEDEPDEGSEDYE